MNLSEKITLLRRQQGLSQEQLADILDVSRQAVYKWESGSNIPGLDKTKKMAQFFGVSFDALLDDNIDLAGKVTPYQHEDKEATPAPESPAPAEPAKPEAPQPSPEPETEPEATPAPTSTIVKMLIGKCKRCGKNIFAGDTYYNVESYIRSGRTHHSVPDGVMCEKCHQKDEEEKVMRRKAAAKHAFRVRMGWSIAISALALLITIIYAVNNPENAGKAFLFFAAIIYPLFAFLFQLFSDEVEIVSDIFVCGFKTFHMPGVIFTLDIDGILFLIGVKLLFGILSAMLSVFCFCFMTALAMLVGCFTFPVCVIRTLRGDDDL